MRKNKKKILMLIFTFVLVTLLSACSFLELKKETYIEEKAPTFENQLLVIDEPQFQPNWDDYSSNFILSIHNLGANKVIPLNSKLLIVNNQGKMIKELSNYTNIIYTTNDYMIYEYRMDQQTFTRVVNTSGKELYQVEGQADLIFKTKDQGLIFTSSVSEQQMQINKINASGKKVWSIGPYSYGQFENETYTKLIPAKVLYEDEQDNLIFVVNNEELRPVLVSIDRSGKMRWSLEIPENEDVYAALYTLDISNNGIFFIANDTIYGYNLNKEKLIEKHIPNIDYTFFEVKNNHFYFLTNNYNEFDEFDYTNDFLKLDIQGNVIYRKNNVSHFIVHSNGTANIFTQNSIIKLDYNHHETIIKTIDQVISVRDRYKYLPMISYIHNNHYYLMKLNSNGEPDYDYLIGSVEQLSPISHYTSHFLAEHGRYLIHPTNDQGVILSYTKAGTDFRAINQTVHFVKLDQFGNKVWEIDEPLSINRYEYYNPLQLIIETEDATYFKKVIFDDNNRDIIDMEFIKVDALGKKFTVSLGDDYSLKVLSDILLTQKGEMVFITTYINGVKMLTIRDDKNQTILTERIISINHPNDMQVDLYVMDDNKQVKLVRLYDQLQVTNPKS